MLLDVTLDMETPTWMIARLVKAMVTGRMKEWSTSVKLGIQPNPPVLSDRYMIWASR